VTAADSGTAEAEAEASPESRGLAQISEHQPSDSRAAESAAAEASSWQQQQQRRSSAGGASISGAARRSSTGSISQSRLSSASSSAGGVVAAGGEGGGALGFGPGGEGVLTETPGGTTLLGIPEWPLSGRSEVRRGGGVRGVCGRRRRTCVWGERVLRDQLHFSGVTGCAANADADSGLLH
jgi:hypothetical protein